MNNNINKEKEEVSSNISGVKNKIIVMSGKGGVGKSSIACNLAAYSASLGKSTALLDVDIHGPSVPGLLGLKESRPEVLAGKIIPVQYGDFLKVISIGFFLTTDREAVIWRGPRKYGLIKQFLGGVSWGNIDNMILDCPPGTGDEPLTVAQLCGNINGALIVTTPQQVAVNDVRRSITFCKQLDIAVLGIIENMSGFICPECKTKVDIFSSGGGELLAKEMNVPFLGRIPIYPVIVERSDAGRLFFSTPELSSIEEEMRNCFSKMISQ